MSYKSRRLEELKEIYLEIKDDEKYEEQQEWVKSVIDSAEYYFSCDYIEDLDNFNGFFEGCQPALDNLIGSEDVRRAEDCADLFVEHFGDLCATADDDELKSIYVRIVDCLLTMVADYGV